MPPEYDFCNNKFLHAAECSSKSKMCRGGSQSMKLFLTTLCLVVFSATAGLAADAAAGKAVYDKSCKNCHGADGTPAPAMAKAMGIKAMSSPEIQALSPADVKKAITEGKGKMKPVTAAVGDSDNLAAYIKTLKK